jgi:hypothetical protein
MFGMCEEKINRTIGFRKCVNNFIFIKTRRLYFIRLFQWFFLVSVIVAFLTFLYFLFHVSFYNVLFFCFIIFCKYVDVR